MLRATATTLRPTTTGGTLISWRCSHSAQRTSSASPQARGRVLAVGDVLIRSDGSDAPVARASLTYSIPPKGQI